MTLDEAIEHAKEVARTCDDSQCAADHIQIAEWLRTARGAEAAGRWYTAKVRELHAENARLRVLVRELWEGYNDPRCEECHLKDTPTCADCPICAREALVIDHLRELGVEVDG